MQLFVEIKIGVLWENCVNLTSESIFLFLMLQIDCNAFRSKRLKIEDASLLVAGTVNRYSVPEIVSLFSNV